MIFFIYELGLIPAPRENLELDRVEFRKPNSDEKIIKYLDKRGMLDSKNFIDADTGVELEVSEKTNLLEYLATKYNEYGAKLEIVTDRSQEGAQFCKGFGGIGGILRYAMNFNDFEVDYSDEEDFDLDDY